MNTNITIRIWKEELSKWYIGYVTSILVELIMHTTQSSYCLLNYKQTL